MGMLRLCILAVCLAAGLHFGYEAWQTYTQHGVPLKTVATYAVPSITHNGIEYTITDAGLQGISDKHRNKLLQLAYFATVARIDPLLALPGVDLEVFRAVIDEIEASQERVTSVYSPEDRKMIRMSLYPISFLKSLHDLEQLRRQVVETPSFSDTETYQRQFVETYELYIENIETLQHAIEVLVPDAIKRSTIRFHTGNSSMGFIANTLAKYQDGITQVYETQLDRFRCYKGVAKYCFEITRPQLPSIVQSTASDEYKNTVMQHQTFIEAFRQDPYRGYSHPYANVELSTSRCGDPDKPGYYYLWWREDDSGLAIFRPDLLHELFFYDFWHGKQADWQYAQVYRTLRGPQYTYQPIASHYVCPDLGLDMATILSMLYVDENKLHIVPVGSEPQPEIDPLIDAANFAYDELTDSQQLIQVAIEVYIDALHALLTSTSESELYEYIGTTATQTAHDLVTVYYARTAYVPDVLMSVVSDNEAVANYALHGTSTGLDELLLLRTVPMVLYGGFTPTIQPQPHTFVREFISEPPDILVTWPDLEIVDTATFVRELQKAERVKIDMSASVGTVYPTNSSN